METTTPSHINILIFCLFLPLVFPLLTMVAGVVPAGPVCLACPMGPPAGPICPGLAWPGPMPIPMPIPIPMPCPWAGVCCWGPVVAGAPGCPGLAACVWACCWSWVLCPGAPSIWEPGPPWRPAGPPAGPWPLVELPDLEEPGTGKGRWNFSFNENILLIVSKLCHLTTKIQQSSCIADIKQHKISAVLWTLQAFTCFQNAENDWQIKVIMCAKMNQWFSNDQWWICEQFLDRKPRLSSSYWGLTYPNRLFLPLKKFCFCETKTPICWLGTAVFILQ